MEEYIRHGEHAKCAHCNNLIIKLTTHPANPAHWWHLKHHYTSELVQLELNCPATSQATPAGDPE